MEDRIGVWSVEYGHWVAPPDLNEHCKTPYCAPLDVCPFCGTVCEADWVDVGVGLTQCGPYHCPRCLASQMGPERHEGMNPEDFFLDEGPKDPEGTKFGWYLPGSPPGPHANTIGGVHVDHKTALSAYKRGLLDEPVSVKIDKALNKDPWVPGKRD